MNKKYLYLLSFGHISADINMGALPAILPFFVSEYGMNYTDVAGIIFASSFLSSVVQPLFGYMADKKERQWFMGLGVLITGLSLAITGFIRDYWTIFFFVTMMGVGNAIFHPEGARNVNKISGAKKGGGMSIFGVGGNIGIGTGPLLAVFLLTTFGMKGLLFFGILAICTSAMLFFVGGKIKRIAKEATTSIGEKSKAVEKNNWPAFRRLFAVILFRSAAITAITGFLPLFCIHVLSASPAAAGATLTVLSLCGAFATLIGGYLSDKIGYVKVVRIGACLLIPCVAVIAFSHSIYAIYAVLIPLSLAMQGSYSAYIVLGQSYLAKSVGFASGVTLGLSFSIGGMVMPFLGKFADNFGLEGFMTLEIGIAVCCALATKVLPNLTKKA
ncbi:MAG: MFS transporter [Selenomonadaceae bacterium]|nr:MFS transporter [Selenomonadaceae bacterium]